MTDTTGVTDVADVTHLPPVRRQVVVAAAPERAFHAWTSELAAWWPFQRHSVCGQGATASFTDGQLVETGPDGSTHVWGTVMTWEPGRRLAMTWHPGQDEGSATTVEVQFNPLGEAQTLVTLTHTGWENRADAIDARDDYRTGWVGVVSRYTDRLGATTARPPAPGESGVTWFLLQHAVWEPGGRNVFADPRFGEHLAFLSRTQERGWLVAAGNLPDSPGSGMTVLCVPDAEAADAVAAAQDDDRSVTGALLGVHIRLWNVALSSLA